jgi:fatty acid/phospholipid biosynthesis enzyme
MPTREKETRLLPCGREVSQRHIYAAVVPADEFRRTRSENFGPQKQNGHWLDGLQIGSVKEKGSARAKISARAVKEAECS